MIYCGHAIDNYGLPKSWDKVEVILKAPWPQSVLQWYSFLKMVSCYYRFLPHIATAVHPAWPAAQENPMVSIHTCSWRCEGTNVVWDTLRGFSAPLPALLRLPRERLDLFLYGSRPLAFDFKYFLFVVKIRHEINKQRSEIPLKG